MTDRALTALRREAKGGIVRAPKLTGNQKTIAEAVAARRGVQATPHWHLDQRNQVDGLDLCRFRRTRPHPAQGINSTGDAASSLLRARG